jgi:hypothetical protein
MGGEAAETQHRPPPRADSVSRIARSHVRIFSAVNFSIV